MRRLVLVGLLSLLLAAPATADFQAGLAAYTRGDYATALKEWRPLAEGGDALAQLYLGLMYESGHGVRPDLTEARRWFERAAAAFPAGADRDRAIAGRDRVASGLAQSPVDAGLLGTWRHTFRNPIMNVPEEWRVEFTATGEYVFTIVRQLASGPTERVEQGRFEAKGGRYTWTSPTEVIRGSYRVLGPDSVELSGPLGTAVWSRVVSATAGTGSPAASPGRVLFEDDFRSKQTLDVGTGTACRKSYDDGGYIVEPIVSGGCYYPSREPACSVGLSGSSWPCGSAGDPGIQATVSSSGRRAAPTTRSSSRATGANGCRAGTGAGRR